jgi:glycosyltransferase involved in cell wall biosynthesis
MVFGEAQRHGLPIVSCRTGAVPDTVPASAGLLVPPDDAPAFSEALRNILTDNDLRQHLAEGSTRAGRNLPTWQDTATLVGAVLDRILAP